MKKQSGLQGSPPLGGAKSANSLFAANSGLIRRCYAARFINNVKADRYLACSPVTMISSKLFWLRAALRPTTR